MVSSIIHRVASDQALDYWQQRLSAEEIAVQREPDRLTFSDPEGMRHELGVFDRPDEPLIARSSDVPEECALSNYEPIRSAVVALLTPLPDIRQWRPTPARTES